MIGRPPTFLVLVGLLAVRLPSGAVAAAEQSEGQLTVDWIAPAGCASREEVQAEIARLLGGRVAISHGGDLDARAMVQHPGGWSVNLTTRHAGRTGRRSIEAPSCESAAQATALIIALMIDPDAVAANAHERTEAAAVALPPAPVAISNDPPTDRPVEPLVDVHSQASLGTLPGVDVGVGLGLGLSGRHWRAGLRGSYGVRRNQVGEVPSTAGAYGRFNITTGSIVGCYRLGQAGFAWGPCAVVEGGLVSAEGHGATNGFAKRAPWLAVGAGGYFALAMGHHLVGSLEIDVMAPLYRPDYVFQDLPGIAFQAPAVGGRALAAIGWRF